MRKFFFPRYSYNFTVPQLCFLCRCLEETRCRGRHRGNRIFERSTMTVFLKEYIDDEDIRKRYYAVDTFSGFDPGDRFKCRIGARPKTSPTRDFLPTRRTVRRGSEQNNITGICSIETDGNEYDLTTLLPSPLSFWMWIAPAHQKSPARVISAIESGRNYGG